MSIRKEIIDNMARAFFADAWACAMEESEEGQPSGCEILDAMPDEIHPDCKAAAEKLATNMEVQYGASLEDLLNKAKNTPDKYADRDCDAEFFGHYAAMQAMGHGVGLESVCDSSIFPNFCSIETPWIEVEVE